MVCPLVEGSPKVEAKAATEEAERLAAEELAGLRVGLLHGQMPSADKEAAMTAFRAGEIDVLVATTVIEVGRRRAERDRDDRGGRRPVRALAAPPAPRPRRSRWRRRRGASCSRIRRRPTARRAWRRWRSRPTGSCSPSATSRSAGPGQVLGERQAGLGDLKLGRLPRDIPYVLKAREVAERILDEDPELEAHRELAEEVEDLLGDSVEFLFKS